MSALCGVCLGGEPDYFCWLLDRAMPWVGGYAVVLEAYFDASERASGTFCVAGFAFGHDRAKTATRKWLNLWGDRKCHMTDLHGRRKDFSDWTAEQAGERLTKSVPIIAGQASFAVAVSCDIAEIARLSPKSADTNSKVLLGGFKEAYGFCSHAAMAALGNLCSESAGVAYFFESGDNFQFESQQFIAQLKAASDVGKRLYNIRSHTILNKSDCRLFEMADILAWEWAKHIERISAGKSMRPSLKALIGSGANEDLPTNISSAKVRLLHVTGERLERFYRRAEECEFFSDHPSPDALAKLDFWAQQF